MIVHNPIKTIKNGKVYLKSCFELNKPLSNLPSSLWYSFPKHLADELNTRADAFAPTALLVAMFSGEDLYVRGSISPRLAYNLFEYRNVYHSWYPKLFKKINITFDHLEPPTPHVEVPGVATAFSGGVDSFYTLWAHMPQNQPIAEAQTTHGLFVHGLDLRLDDEINYQLVAESYNKLFETLGLELIRVGTNAYHFSEYRINWLMFQGVPLIGASLCLGNLLHRLYMPSGMPSYRMMFPAGSHPLIDYLLSTENLEIVHHGASVDRIEKTATISNWPITYHKLRVCSDKVRIQGWNNCCKCHKCYRTMVILDLIGMLSRYNNFSRRMTPIDYLRWGALKQLNIDTAASIRNRAILDQRIGMAFWIQVAIVLRAISIMLVELVKKILSEKQLYRLKRTIYQPEIDPTGMSQ